MHNTRAGRREWVGLAVLVLPCLLISMDVSVLFFALPFISAELAPSATEQLWIMDSYGFALAGALITMGALGDRIGRRRLLLIGAAAFGGASVVAAYSPSAELLVLTRGLLGLAGATLMPSTLALVRNLFADPAQRKTAISVWMGGMTTGAVIGPIVGGFLLEHFWWGSAFLINVPAMVLLLVLGPLLLPEPATTRAGRFDLVGAGLSSAATLAVVYSIKDVAVEGLAPVPVAVGVLGLVLGALFAHRQRVGANPLFDVGLFRLRAFRGSVVVNVLATFCFIGITLFTSQYMQLVLGLSPFAAALWSLAVMPAVAIAMTVSGVLAHRVRVASLVCSGLVVLAGALAVLAQVRADSPLWLLLVGTGAVAAGVLVTSTLTGDQILTAAPPESAGAASAVAETAGELGGALGLAVLGAVGSAIYHREMAAAVTGLPAEAARAAQDTLGGAVAVAGSTPGGADLLVAAREAFTSGFTAAAITGAVLVAATAVYAYRALRHIPAPA